MSRSASALIRFSPNPGSGGGSSALDQLSLTLTVRLDGATMSTTSGQRLSTALTIPFAPQGFCDRARLIGINPTGHAPLVVPKAGYWGSTCGYADPAMDVFYVYSDDDDRTQNDYEDALDAALDALDQATLDATTNPSDETLQARADRYAEYQELLLHPPEIPNGGRLVIDFPCNNLFGCFRWPSAVVEFDPPLGEDEVAPSIALRLDGLVGLDGQSETGVRLPMRLFLIEPGVTGETELAVLNYAQAPHFVGSGEQVTVKPSEDAPDPDAAGLFRVTGRELDAATAGRTGDYELWWRIYHGSGDMRYTATCATPDDPATPETNEVSSTALGEVIVDRRNAGLGGGFGLWATTDIRVARVRVEKEPWPFWMRLRRKPGATVIDTQYDVRGTEVRTPEDGSARMTFVDDWVGERDGQPIALSWVGDAIYLAGRRLVSSPSPVLGAAVRELPSLNGDFAGWGLIWLARASRSDDFGIRLYAQRLAVNAPRHAVAVIPGVRRADYARAHFNRSGQQACLLYPPVLADTLDDFRNGALYALDLDALENPASLALTPVLTPDDAPSVFEAAASRWNSLNSPQPFTLCKQLASAVDGFTCTHYGISYDYRAEIACLIDARYVEDVLTPTVLALSLDARGLFDTNKTFSASGITDPDAVNPGPAIDCPDESHYIAGERFGINTLTFRTQFDNHYVVTLNAIINDDVHCLSRGSYVGDAGEFFSICEDRVVRMTCAATGESKLLLDNSSTLLQETHPWPRERLTFNRGLKCAPQGRSGPVLVDYGSRETNYLPHRIPASIDTDEHRIRVSDLDNRLLIEVPDEWDERARAWIIPGEAADNDAAATALKAAMALNLRNLLQRRSTVRETDWLALDTKSLLAPEGDDRLTALTWAHNDTYNAWPISRSRYAMATGESYALLNDFSDAYRLSLGVLTPWACAWAPDPGSVKPDSGGCAGVTPPAVVPTESGLIAAHNRFRAAHGLGELAANLQLAAAIAGHLSWLKDEGTGISHTGENGSQPLDRALAAGYAGAVSTGVGENLALGHTTIESVMAAWENSPEHYANLADADWAEIGVAILPADGGGYWWGALFGVRA